jgi:uncharacterized protein
VEALAKKLLAEDMLDSAVEICWHAGEPLVVPIADYERLIGALDCILRRVVTVQYSLQTNATLVSTEWCDFFQNHGIRVGVSLDGPRHIHDRYRLDRSGKGTFDRVIRGIEMLQRNGLSPYVIGVLHRESLAVPDELFHFFQATGVKEVCFNIEEIEGANHGTSLAYADVYRETVEFFRRYFELVETTPDSHWMREFSYTLRRLCASTVHNAQTNPFEMITVDHRGEYSTFSPELVGISTQEIGSMALGSVFSDKTFRDAFSSAGWVRDVASGVDLCRRACRYFDVCGGGAPSNKLAENGSFASSETLNCRLGIQAPVEAMLSHFGDKLVSGGYVTDSGMCQ